MVTSPMTTLSRLYVEYTGPVIIISVSKFVLNSMATRGDLYIIIVVTVGGGSGIFGVFIHVNSPAPRSL